MLNPKIDWQESQSANAQADTLYLMGEMAVSIGHQVRNPMTTIRGYLQLFSQKNHFADYKEQLCTMIEEIDQVNAVISELLSLAPNKRIDLKIGSINSVIGNLSQLLETNLMKSGHFLYIDMAELPEISFDEKEIAVLILNLVKNCQDATPQGGSISIKTYKVEDGIVLSVQDTGCGMPQDIVDKLEMSYIIKKASRVGLGLAICYQIAEHHKACINITTSQQGTTVNVLFKANQKYEQEVVK